jgi:flagellar hook-associated protein 1
MGNSILGAGISGLQAAQRGLSVTSNNIANVNTEGYSRQRVEQATRNPQLIGGMMVSNGVTISAIERLYNEFNTRQLQSTTAGQSQAEQFYRLTSQVNNLLASSGSGIMPAMQDFFDAVQGVANDPSSTVARQVMISEAEHLAGQIRHFNGEFAAMRQNTNASLRTTVSEIDDLTTAIAGLNQRIMDAGNSRPNDLLDQRDELIRRLAEKVSVSTTRQSDGSINVFIGSGQAVVAGVEARGLVTVPGVHDSERLEIAYDVSPQPVIITNQLSGGRLGGILEFRGQVLEPVQNAVNRLAVGIAETFNARHAMGMDLNGNLGGDFFTALNGSDGLQVAQVLASTRNSGDAAAQPGVTITDAGALTASHYLLERSGSQYLLTRQSDNAIFILTEFPNGEETVDGITLAPGNGTMADGDSFLIRPAHHAAENFGVALRDPARIAAAEPVRTITPNANTGSGSIDAGRLTDLDAYTGETYTVVAVDSNSDGVVDSYNVLDQDDTVIKTGAYVPGGDIDFDGIRVRLGGAPDDGDYFIVEPNTNGVGDNRNALALAELQSLRILAGGSASYESLYGRMVADVGNKARQAESNLEVQNGQLQRAVDARESVSGVNLDEEAAAIMRYQQAYQAAARVIATANTLFDSLLAVLRR